MEVGEDCRDGGKKEVSEHGGMQQRRAVRPEG